jgi:hypothetical protein
MAKWAFVLIFWCMDKTSGSLCITIEIHKSKIRVPSNNASTISTPYGYINNEKEMLVYGIFTFV